MDTDEYRRALETGAELLMRDALGLIDGEASAPSG
jgi:hypothetical protein